MAEMSRHNGRRLRRPMSQINVVPFIDVMLVLLIIFMITAPMLQQGVEVDLPEAEAQALETDQRAAEPIVVTVTAAGALSVNQGPLANEPLAGPQLVELVTDLLVANPGIQTYVRGDRHVDYGRVMDAMVALQRAGAGRVGLLTEPPPREVD
ncbi:Tol biopolymer transport system, TolR protein [Thioalkalivibrio nitratireducens DSM 14787]|uniref:Tol-Pal system protein TolR n=1 Tax=Thioalkalivibrio nitratireducens (strain DSM 14787 / UNIQEM 213 / ALEN2) TaxID=1255043 RepID=L0E183_THIND|nr:protein TolR [Thioalkalivibrio nitratireducens]AGA35007.1 Tol biopolymer transport system, TolR protein [Thioalkalivibrio nitratireducens DSM 14787]